MSKTKTDDAPSLPPVRVTEFPAYAEALAAFRRACAAYEAAAPQYRGEKERAAMSNTQREKARRDAEPLLEERNRMGGELDRLRPLPLYRAAVEGRMIDDIDPDGIERAIAA